MNGRGKREERVRGRGKVRREKRVKEARKGKRGGK